MLFSIFIWAFSSVFTNKSLCIYIQSLILKIVYYNDRKFLPENEKEGTNEQKKEKEKVTQTQGEECNVKTKRHAEGRQKQRLKVYSEGQRMPRTPADQQEPGRSSTNSSPQAQERAARAQLEF